MSMVPNIALHDEAVRERAKTIECIVCKAHPGQPCEDEWVFGEGNPEGKLHWFRRQRAWLELTKQL